MRNISFRFQARKQETKQSVKRDKKKVEHGVKIESENAFTRKKSSNKKHTKHLSVMVNDA